jgi:hypothetical protein
MPVLAPNSRVPTHSLISATGPSPQIPPHLTAKATPRARAKKLTIFATSRHVLAKSHHCTSKAGTSHLEHREKRVPEHGDQGALSVYLAL